MPREVIFKKVFLDELPRCKNRNNYIDWESSVGHKVKFIYETLDDKIEDEVEIINYINSKGDKNRNKRLTIKYKNNIKEMAPGQFSRCELGVLLNKINSIHIYPIGTIVTDVNSGILEIKEHLTISGKRKRRAYKYICMVCGNEDIVDESNLISNKTGCNFCAGKKVLRGRNDLWITHPEIAKYLKYPEEGYEISSGCNKKKVFKCSDCGHERKATINDITSDGFTCTVCSDGISYPEKFMSELLKQINVTFEREKSFKWSKGKRYDFYIPFINCIVETHGKQHYDDSFSWGNRNRDYKEEKENDLLKYNLAVNNSIKYYIIIDSSVSKREYIKNNITNSLLNELFDLSKVNWEKCERFAFGNLVKEVCDMWNNRVDITTIKNTLNISQACIRNYLKQGAKIGWCNYNSKTNNLNPKSQKVICLNDKKIYHSIYEATKNYNCSGTTITNFCKGIITCNDEELNGTYLQWQFYNEYLKYPRELLPKDYIDNIKIFQVNKRKVICLNNNKVFEFIKDATEYAGLKTSSAICSCCRGNYKSAGKDSETGEPLRWMYYDDYTSKYLESNNIS